MTTRDAQRDRFRILAREALEGVVELTRQVCLVPAPTGAEGERARFVADALAQRGLVPEIDAMDNVVARRRGRGDAPTLMLAAHTDTVFPAGTPIEVTRQGDQRMTGPGVGDNSLSVATLITLAELLEAAKIDTPGDVLFVADVGEEGLGNLRGIRAMVDRFESELGGVIALEGHGLGKITHQGVGSRRIRVTVTGPGGHSYGSFGQPSAIHTLGTIIHRIAQLDVPASPKTTYNVGLIEGGVSVNTIAPTAAALIDMRSVDPASLDALVERVERIVEAMRGELIDVSIELIGERPAGAIPADTPLVNAAEQVVASLGLEPKLDAGSTDANIPIARGIPAIRLGLTRGRGAHQMDETIELPPIALGLRQLLHVIERFPVGEQPDGA